ncbi:MAG: hypothetical protein ACE5R6_17970 [Candidatus Heimdallarchaeota archaeon]
MDNRLKAEWGRMIPLQRPFLILGFILIALGVVLELLQLVLEFAPRLE